MKMSNWPSASDANTIHWPSGDQCGTPVPVGALRDESWIALAPSRSEIQISHAPERVLVKATRRPSGESCGCMSAFVEAMATAGGDEAAAPGPEVSMRQILSSLKLRTYASRAGLPGARKRTPASRHHHRRTAAVRAGRRRLQIASTDLRRRQSQRSKRGSLCHWGTTRQCPASGPGPARAWPHQRQSCRYAIEARAVPRGPGRSSQEQQRFDRPERQTGLYRRELEAAVSSTVSCRLFPMRSPTTHPAFLRQPCL